MQTQCPHCDTQFRITEEQYQIADGLVRCGVCNETFNAFEVNQDDAQLPIEPTVDNLVKNDDESNEQYTQQTVSSSTAMFISSEEDDSTEHHNELIEESLVLDEHTASLVTSDDPLNSPFNNPFENAASSSTTEEPFTSFENEDNEDRPKAQDTANDTDSHQHGNDVNDETSANTSLDDKHPEKHETEFDLFQTEDAETLSPDLRHSIVPEECITKNSHAVFTGVLWSVAILFLTFTLVAEYIWFNRNQLIQIPQAEPWVERFCQLTNCEIAALRDPAQIELVTRNIYSHPNQKDALIVAVTLVNHANFAQPYPLMQIDFSDVRGGVIAARRFNAQTYLQTPKEQLRLLAPEATSSFTMVIQDPGKQAMTYEFNFL